MNGRILVNGFIATSAILVGIATDVTISVAQNLSSQIVQQNVSPAELRARLSQGSFVPISRRKWDQLSASSLSGGSAINEARYTAVFANRSLSGTFEAQVTHTDPSIEFDPLSFSLTDLQWHDKSDAIAGANESGRYAVLANSESDQLTGKWNAAGTLFGASTTFQLDFPKSASTVFEVVTPGKFHLQATQGIVSSEPAIGNRIRWTIFPGSQSSTHITIAPTVTKRKTAVLFVDQTVSVWYTGDATKVDAEYKFEAIDPGVTQLQFEIDKSFSFDSVEYGDTRLLPITKVAGGQMRLTLNLPELLTGPGRTLTIEASAATAKPGTVVVPRIRMSAARSTRSAAKIAIRNETIRLRVDPPFVLESLNPEGFQQTDAVFSREGRHTVTFSRRSESASIKATLGEQDAILQPTIVETIDTSTRPLTATSQIRVRMTSGLELFDLACSIREGWDVTQVTSGAQQAPLNALVINTGDTQRILRIELPNPILPEMERTFTVTTQRLPDPVADDFSFPIARLVGFEDSKHLVHIRHRKGQIPQLEPGSSFVESSLVPEAPASDSKDTSVVSLQPNSRSAVGRMRLPRRDEIFDASANTTLTIDDNGLRERVVLEIRPVERAAEAVQVRFAGSAPPLEWTFENQKVDARILNRENGVSLIEIQLPRPVAKVFQIECDQVRSVPLENCAIPFIPDAGKFDGNLRLQHTTGSLVEMTEEPNLIQVEQPSAQGTVAWTYDTDIDFGFVSIDQSDRAALATVQLSSTLASNSDGLDQHLMLIRIDPESSRTDLRLKFPADHGDYRVRLNRLPITQPNPVRWVIPLSENVAVNEIEIRFRQSNASGILWSNRRPSLPVIDSHHVSGFDWNVVVRDSVRIASVPASFVGSHADTAWSTRFFGVLSMPEASPETLQLYSPTIPADLGISVQERTTVTKALWLLIAITVTSGVVFRKDHSCRLLFALAILILPVICLWPDSLPPIPGTIMTGLIMVVTIPTVVIRAIGVQRPQATPTRLSDSSRVAASVVALLLMCGTLQAQVPSSVPKLTVLTPTLPDGSPSPVVYVDTETYDHLQSRSHDRYVITDAEYRLDVAASGKTKLRVLTSVAATALPIQVRLPFSDLNPGECRVNGLETQYLTDGANINVTINDTGLKPIDAEQSVKESSQQNTKRQQHKIEIILRPKLTESTDQTEVGFRLIPAPSGHFSVNLPREYASVEGLFDGQAESFVRKSESYSFTFGLRRSAVIRWSSTVTRSATPSLESEQACLVKLYRDFGIVELIETLNGHRQDPVTWTLPDGVEVAPIVSSDLAEISRITDRNGRTKIQFEPPSAEHARIQATLRIVWDHKKRYVVPAFDLHSDDSTIQTTRRVVAVSAEPGFTAYVKSNVQVEQTSMPEELLSIAEQSPDHVYQLDHPVDIEFGVSTDSMDSTSRATRLQQSLLIGRDEVVWSAAATVQSGSKDVFEHTLLVDPLIKIEQVTLEAGQASRLERWVARGNRLTLFLSRPTNDDEVIRLTGRFPVGKIVKLPRFEFLNTITLESLIDVSHRPDIRLEQSEISDKAALTIVSRGFEGDSSVGIPFARYRVSGAVENPYFRVRPLDNLVAHISQLIQNTGTELTLETKIRIQDSEKSGQSIRLQLPSQLTVKDSDIVCDGVSWIRSGDDAKTLLVNSERAPVAGYVFQINSTIPWPTTGFEVPTPRIIGRVTTAESYLQLPSELRPDAKPQSRRIEPSELPSWARGTAVGESTGVWVGEGRWSVRLAETESDRRTGVPLRIDRLTGSQTGTIFGRTTIITDSRFPANNLNWPKSLSLRQLTINNRPVDAPTNQSGELFIHRDQLSRAAVIDVHWVMKPNSLWQRFVRRIEFPFPQLAGECCLLQLDRFSPVDPNTAGVTLTATPPVNHYLVYAQQFLRIWGAIAPDQQLSLRDQLIECFQAVRLIEQQSANRTPLTAELDSKFKQLSAIITQGEFSDVQSHSQPGPQQLFRIRENRLHTGLSIRTAPQNSGPALLIGGLLMIGWGASWLISRIPGLGRVKTESLVSIAAGFVWIVFLHPTTVGLVFVGLGLVAPKLSTLLPALQTPRQTEPIAMAPTPKQ